MMNFAAREGCARQESDQPQEMRRESQYIYSLTKYRRFK